MILRAKKLTKSFKQPGLVQVLDALDLEVADGEKLAIMGKSGEGKSTLLHLLGALESPSGGTLEFRGDSYEKIGHTKLRRSHFGFIFQDFNLLEEYTALENVLMPAKIARKNVNKGSSAHEKALLLLEQVGLFQRAHFLGKYLSGGEKQRVSLARALMNDPDLILADEPSGSLDSKTSQAMYELLFSSVNAHKKTLIVVTHDTTLASLCDRTLTLHLGKLHQKTL